MIRKIIENCNFWLPKPLKIEICRGLGTVFGESGGILDSLGASWGRFGRALGASCRVQGRLGGVLVASWENLGRVLGGFGSLLVVFWK